MHFDAFTCDLFRLIVSQPGAESDIIIRVFKSEAKNTHPGSIWRATVTCGATPLRPMFSRPDRAP